MKPDSISFFLTRIRNALKARHKKVDISTSKVRVALAELMKTSGFIQDYKLFRQGERGILRIYLKYRGKGEPMIHGLKRVSLQSRRVYASSKEIPTLMGGIGISVISTSKGFLTDQQAKDQKLGGEVICQVW